MSTVNPGKISEQPSRKIDIKASTVNAGTASILPTPTTILLLLQARLIHQQDSTRSPEVQNGVGWSQQQSPLPIYPSTRAFWTRAGAPPTPSSP